MKYIFLTIIGMFITINSFSQEYPKLDTDSNGNKIIVMTYEQAQKIDNGLDLLFLLEQLELDFKKNDEVTLNVINDQNQLISSQKIEIDLLRKSNSNKDNQIENLKSRLNNCENMIQLSNDQIMLKDDIINENNKQIKKLKKQKAIGIVINIVTIVIATLLIL
jgi:translation initiation factor 6 (eIF-6)